jgi:hypothetical protein
LGLVAEGQEGFAALVLARGEVGEREDEILKVPLLGFVGGTPKRSLGDEQRGGETPPRTRFVSRMRLRFLGARWVSSGRPMRAIRVLPSQAKRLAAPVVEKKTLFSPLRRTSPGVRSRGTPAASTVNLKRTVFAFRKAFSIFFRVSSASGC